MLNYLTNFLIAFIYRYRLHPWQTEHFFYIACDISSHELKMREMNTI